MDIPTAKEALLVAQRAYDRAMRAKTCGEAANNFRLGQGQAWRAADAVRALLPAKLEYRFWSPARRELAAVADLLPNAEYNAHLHVLDKCGISQLVHERQAAAARVDKTDSAYERHLRKRPKRRR